MRLWVSLILIFIGSSVFGQSIYIGYGLIYTHTAQKVRMVNSRDDFQHTDNQFLVGYEHYFRKEGFSLLMSFTKFDGYTFIKFREGSVIASDGFPVIGDGFSGVNIFRYDLGMAYNLFSRKKSFYIKPIFCLGLQKSIKKEVEFYSNLFKAEGPEYFELEPIRIEKLNTTQLVPSLGLKTGILLWKQIELGLSVQGVLGFKSYQNMYFKYYYKGVTQETAIFQGKGTGLYTALNIGYRFVKPKK